MTSNLRETMVVALLLVLFALAELYPALCRLSPAQDEPSHVRSGLTMLTGSRYVDPAQAWWTSLDALHPPSDMLFGLAALAVGDSPDFRAHIHPTLAAVRAARCVSVALAVGLLLLVYLWLRGVWGHAAGLLGMGTVALQPLVFAHAGLASSDLTMLCGGLLAAWALWRRWVRSPEWLAAPALRPAAMAALELGAVLLLATLCKVSNLYFVAVQAALACLALWRLRRHARAAVPKGIAVAAGVVFVSTLLCLLGASLVWQAISPQRPPVGLLGGRLHLPFANAFLFSAHTALSIQNLLPNPVYFGHLRPPSWKFYALAIVLKTPFPLLLVWLSLPALLRSGWARLSRLQRDAYLYILILGAGMGLVFATRGVYLGLRHLILPLALGGLAAAPALALQWQAGTRRARALVAAFLLLMLVCQAAYPWQLSYFNFRPLLPEPLPLVDSDSDWGQGLIALRGWQRRHPQEPLWLSSFANFRPENLGLRYRGLLSPYGYVQTDPNAELGRDPEKVNGYIAISATQLAGTLMATAGKPEDYFAAWRHERPVALLGGSIYLFRGKAARAVPSATARPQ